ncbi:MAG TPA: non-ribosomal peptide synthetase [Streptosporangiaceae bacterium]|nr:non-ribosomal peptide synthetase [Streptosporangiaceae bacterium]
MCNRPTGAPDIVSRIAENARRMPAALAVYCDGETMTYRELDRWSAAIARDLALAGIGPGDGVAVQGARSLAFQAGVLAVMRAGAWYLAINPEQAVQRRTTLFRRAGCAALLADRDSDTAWRPPGIPVLDLGRREADPWQVRSDPARPAYVCFTSGTTAAPKAVQISRESLSVFTDVLVERVGIRPRWSLAGFCPVDWDGFVIDAWVPLVAGATAATGYAADRTNPDKIAQFIADRAVEVAFLPTAIGQIVMESRHMAGARELRHLCVGGDRLTRRPATDASYVMWNLYGPTEATVAAIAGPVAPEGPADIPLGTPLRGASVEIVDERLDAVPPGEAGEIVIGGSGVAVGYLGQPQETEAAFVPGPAGRRYRTGDLGRILPDGQIAFLGRRDRQVSIHGRRVELDGVAAALRQVPGVIDAAAVAAKTGSARTLVAFAAVAAGSDLTADGIRARLGEWLSGQHVPDRVVVVPSIPGNIGEMDEGAVADLLASDEFRPRPRAHNAGKALAGQAGECVADSWTALVGGDRPGLDDNFFDWGGDSLMAVLLVQRIQEALGVELPVMDFLDSPTPRFLLGALALSA